MKLFLLDSRHPSHEVEEREVSIKVCKMTVWAVRPSGRRYLMGSTAFCTRVAALRSQRATIQDRLKHKGFKLAAPEAHARMERRLVLINSELLH